MDVDKNPLREGLQGERVPAPTTFVIFGASGDLTKRKLVPALYSLTRDRLLPSPFNVVGVARRDIPQETFRGQMREATDKYARRRPVEDALWQSFSEGIFYVNGTFEDPATYQRLKKRLDEIDAERDTAGNRVFYLSTPPSEYPIIVKQLGAAGLINKDRSGPFTRVIIEKPFGHDLASAQALNKEVHEVLREDQTFRIDHYLGKETVQNILVFRFANGIWEPLWNARYIDHVQLTVAEAIGVEGRGGYFEQAGILRDMVQNHMFQFLCLTTMEPPVAFEAEAVRDEKLKVLRSLHPLPATPEEVAKLVVRGQYGRGFVNGEERMAYREEQGVAKDSTVETFVALKLQIDNWRWAGVPFYLRAAKAMPKRVTEIAIHFKRAPHMLFGKQSRGRLDDEPNVLSIRIQPDEGISLKFFSKVPGPTMEVLPVPMEFRYGTSFGAEPPEAYERLILDCLLGDGTLFTRGDEVEASWAWIDRIEKSWAATKATDFPNYASGTWGPAAADRLIEADGRHWRKP
ncbi:MAG: glucose-6-phosphate 1-dehydrogenase [Myxococcales bacterium]|nr:glucose-6-phosphate 1-dehydrogenase [Myxococcales bacterium]